LYRASLRRDSSGWIYRLDVRGKGVAVGLAGVSAILAIRGVLVDGIGFWRQIEKEIHDGEIKQLPCAKAF
jgi:hypothetical protein